ncbi:MAG: hypothetical protein ACTSWQ_02770 [Candidatus Thorarchaeota archaeon]
MMFTFRKKKDKEEETIDEIVDERVEGESTNTGLIHAIEDSDGLPESFKKRMAEIRGEPDKGYEMVEVDDEGNPIKTDTDEDEESVVKDDEVSSGETDDSAGDSEKDTSEAEAVEDDSEFEEVELDPRLEAAGKSLGWSDDKIRLVAETDLSILEDIATRLDSKEGHRQEQEEVQGKDDLVDKDTMDKLTEKLGADAKDVLEILQKQVEAKFSERFKDVDSLKEAREEDARMKAAMQRYEIASEVFDRHVEDFNEFGTTKNLPKNKDGSINLNSPQMAVREKVYRVATMFHQNNGGTFESAMREALTWYAGSQGVSKATRQVVKDLKTNAKRFSPRPTRRKMVNVFKSTEAKAADIVRQAKRKAGIE